MPHFVAFEAHLCIAVERVMGVLPTENAGGPLGLIGTVTLPMAILHAVLALDRRVSVVSEEAPLLARQLLILIIRVLLFTHPFTLSLRKNRHRSRVGDLLGQVQRSLPP